MLHNRRNCQGFTLIEVLVAFAIFALTIGAIFEVFAGAGRRAEKAERRETLWLTAQSLLSQLRVRTAPWPAEEHGSVQSWQWVIRVQPYDAGAGHPHAWKAYLVSVNVGDGTSRNEVLLQSVELAKDAL